MSDSEIAIVLREIIDSNAKLQLVHKVIKSIDLSLDSIDADSLEMDLIAPSLHHIYCMQSSVIRAAILRICCHIEMMSSEMITEKYYFDYLVSNSLDQKPPDPQPKVDDEKVAAFSYIFALLKYRKYLPMSILRGLISLYSNPVLAYSGQYKKLIVSILCEASLFCEDLIEIPEMCQIFVDSLIETGSPVISSLLSYSIENKLPIVRENRFLSPLLFPLAQLKPSEKLSNARRAISLFLRTWPGFLYYGIQSGAIIDLMRCLPHETDSVISILRDLLKLDGTIPAVTDGFCGLFLSILLKLDLIEKLNQIASAKPSAASFLNDLLPYTSHSGIYGVDLTQRMPNHSSMTSPNIPNSTLFDLAQTMIHDKQITSINNFVLDPDPKLWEWTPILILLTVVLPHNEAEANSNAARQFYKSLFNYFSGAFLTATAGKCATMVEPLFALIQLLMNKSWGSQIIESNTQMKNAMLQVLNSLRDNVAIDPSSPQWALFRCVTSLMSEGNGISILSHWGFHDILTTLGNKCTNPNLCETILGIVKLYPEADLSIPVFWQFLSSPNNDIHKIAINDLRRKRHTTPNFQLGGFRGLLMPHVKELCATNSISKLPIALNLLGEIISTDCQSLLTVATDKQLHEMLSQHSHIIYSLVLSREESLKFAPIDDEIKWWMEFGNLDYLRVFDKSIECTFTGNLDVSVTNEPAIFDHNGFAPAPPHLFGQLSRTQAGLEKLTPLIPQLVEQLEKSSSVDEKRAAMFALAHFASVPSTAEIIEKYDIAEKIIISALNSSSYVLKGTLISALSLFAQSLYLSSVLQRHNWQLFMFGSHQCVIPCNPLELFEPLEKTPPPLLTIDDLEGHSEAVTFLKQLANTLLVKSARQSLTQLLNTQKKDIALALYANELISNFHFSTDSRQFIYFLFRQTPLMKNVKFDYNQITRANVYAKLSELENSKTVDIPFTQITLPTKTPEMVQGELAKIPFPEAFLNDSDFLRLTNMTKEDFYRLNEKDQAKIRQRIVDQS
ncbi:hypothetical protein TRFO_41991 [Tritrichomonas foetus]|uniref:Uncharacterized protein n=1 Tax=Tritrichomonas foetus TaxID=1144522 RepID=A0A1J4KZ87_9EUKA|nr:hypothetical protein TRFO_41991 [Tritrichomonas foetus]|eukprot:OHT16176.1 hypothetical protein TRFO_41991 [Tritrichomonas foetus]